MLVILLSNPQFIKQALLLPQYKIPKLLISSMYSKEAYRNDSAGHIFIWKLRKRVLQLNRKTFFVIPLHVIARIYFIDGSVHHPVYFNPM